MTPELGGLITALETAGLTAAANALRQLQPSNAIERMVLQAVGDYVDRYGLAAVTTLQGRVQDLLAGKPVDLDLTDLRVASDMLAVLQQTEQAQHQAVLDVLAKVGDALGVVAGALLKAAVSTAL